MLWTVSMKLQVGLQLIMVHPHLPHLLHLHLLPLPLPQKVIIAALCWTMPLSSAGEIMRMVSLVLAVPLIWVITQERWLSYLLLICSKCFTFKSSAVACCCGRLWKYLLIYSHLNLLRHAESIQECFLLMIERSPDTPESGKVLIDWQLTRKVRSLRQDGSGMNSQTRSSRNALGLISAGSSFLYLHPETLFM